MFAAMFSLSAFGPAITAGDDGDKPAAGRPGVAPEQRGRTRAPLRGRRQHQPCDGTRPLPVPPTFGAVL